MSVDSSHGDRPDADAGRGLYAARDDRRVCGRGCHRVDRADDHRQFELASRGGHPHRDSLLPVQRGFGRVHAGQPDYRDVCTRECCSPGEPVAVHQHVQSRGVHSELYEFAWCAGRLRAARRFLHDRGRHKLHVHRCWRPEDEHQLPEPVQRRVHKRDVRHRDPDHGRGEDSELLLLPNTRYLRSTVGILHVRSELHVARRAPILPSALAEAFPIRHHGA